MTKVVDVPGLGEVEFPDEMEPDEMVSHIQNHLNEKTLATSPFDVAAKRTRETVHPESGRKMGPATGFLEEAAQGIPVLGAAAQETPEAAQLREEHPGAATAARLMGRIVGSAPAFAAAPGFLGATAVGGALGAADKTARGGSLEDVGNAAAIGAAGGALGHTAGSLIGKGVGAVASWLTKPGGIFAGYSSQAIETAANAARATGLNESQIAAKAQQLGPQGFLAEYGPQLEGMAGGIASRTGPGQDIVRNAFEGRAGGAGDRIESEINRAMGPALNMHAVTAAREAERAAASTPLYQQFRNTDVPMTPELESLLPRLKAADAIGPAYKKMAIQGVPAANTYFKVESGEPTLNTFPAPKAETWDYMKRALDDKINTAQARGEGDNVRIFTSLKNDLTNAIDNHPDPNVADVWKAARQAYAEPTAIQKAQEAGQKLFWRSTRADEDAAEFAGMSIPEKQANIEGARDAVRKVMEDSARGDTNAINLIRSPHVQQKLETRLGPERTARLVDAMDRERQFAGNLNTITRNSETARRTAFDAALEPKEGLVSRLTHFYHPDVTPLGFLRLTGAPAHFENMAATRYEALRGDLGKMLTKQGSDAKALIDALMAHHPAGPPAAQSTKALIRGLIGSEVATGRK